MFLRAKTRIKDGKEHRYWSVVENRRVSGGKTIQRQVLYLGEIGGGQQMQWSRALEAFDEGTGRMTQIALFPEDRKGAAPGGAARSDAGSPEGFRASSSAAVGRLLAGVGAMGARRCGIV